MRLRDGWDLHVYWFIEAKFSARIKLLAREKISFSGYEPASLNSLSCLSEDTPGIILNLQFNVII